MLEIRTSIDVEHIVKLLNSKKTTLQELCDVITNDIQAFRLSRENFHLQEFKEQNDTELNEYEYDIISREIIKRVESEVKKYIIGYTTQSIDSVLDAINDKKFKYKRSATNFIVLLTKLRDSDD
jgi:hypothetical protein